MIWDRWDLYVDVDAVQEGAGDAAEIVSDLQRGAATFLLGIAKKPAGTGIHGTGKYKLGWKTQAHG